MAGYILSRGLEVVPTVLLVLTLVFLALRILPGDPAIAALGEYATPEAIATFRQKLGLDQSLWMQYLTFVGHALTGDFGVSMTNGTSINALLLDSLPYTIELALAATLIGIVIGVPLGAWAAVRRNRAPDVIGRLFALAGFSLPDFYVGVLLLLAFSLHLDWFPMLGGGEGVLDKLHHLALPAITLGVVMAAFVMRLVRTSLLEVLRRDYVRTARGKGVESAPACRGHRCRTARRVPPMRIARRAARSRRRTAAPGRAGCDTSAALSVRVLRRPAPAHRHRPRAGTRTEDDRRG